MHNKKESLIWLLHCGFLYCLKSQKCSDHVPSPQDASTNNFLEVGAAALLVGDMEAKTKGRPWRIFGTTDMPYLDQLLQPSLLTTVTSSASARAHLTAITASKRTKSGPHQIWHVLLTQFLSFYIMAILLLC